ncbi:hypothetical protein CE195_13240 [Sodalis-like symbiont of Philaenus spumarius]|nr:hypothetical protein CE195_13240 [Sodalis-like symbiont of Philaenus spumarius]
MTTTKCYSREVRERAVNLVLETQHEHDSQWKAILSIAPKIGCIPETLRLWIKQQEQRLAVKNNLNADERQWIKVLERENRELRRSNDILRQAAAYLPRRRSTATVRNSVVNSAADGTAWGRAGMSGTAYCPGNVL